MSCMKERKQCMVERKITVVMSVVVNCMFKLNVVDHGLPSVANLMHLQLRKTLISW